MQPARYGGFFVCTRMMDSWLTHKIKNFRRGLIWRMLVCALWWAVLLGKGSVAQISTLRWSSREAEQGRSPSPCQAWNAVFPHHGTCLPLLLRTALPCRLPQWLQWVLEADSELVAVRGVVFTVYIARGSDLSSPLCSSPSPLCSRDVKSRISPSMHLAVCVCISPAGRAVGAVCIDCWPFEILALPIAWIFYKY